ncbi:hypothetical protein NKH33_31585 [Mesorhizobium sp. M1182]|uniref:hypothetical protein n=1 Tax=Mesorhizobium sp. M1182 TaxID=2957067 RepID=UPI00333B64C0
MRPADIPIKDRPPFRFEAGQQFQSKVGQFSALNITSWVSNFGIKCPVMNGEILMPQREG